MASVVTRFGGCRPSDVGTTCAYTRRVTAGSETPDRIRETEPPNKGNA